MFEFITQHLAAIILALIALFAGIVITIRIVNKSRKDSNKVNQSGNIVGGDLVGRDKKN